MSVLPQELLRKISAESRNKSSEQTSDIPDQRFRELMRVEPVDDSPYKKDVFSLLLEQEEDEDNAAEIAALSLAPMPVPLSVSDSSSDEEKGAIAMAPCILPASQLTAGTAAVSASPYCAFDPAIEALFERMASAMIVMCSSGETETTLYLDNPHFASSVFFGSKITIREFSTAPKAFNIEFSSVPAAIASFDANKQSLLSSFQNGNFNFSVHRIDTHIQSEDRPVLHRKENEDHGQQDRKGGREQ